MPVQGQDMLEHDLAVIFRPGPARARAVTGLGRPIGLALLGLLCVIALALLVSPRRLAFPQPSSVATSVSGTDAPAPSGYIAVAPGPPLAQPDFQPLEAPVPAVAPVTRRLSQRARSARTGLTARLKPQRSLRREATLDPLPKRDRLTLASEMPQQDDAGSEADARQIEMRTIGTRIVRLEAVDAIRTLRLR